MLYSLDIGRRDLPTTPKSNDHHHLPLWSWSARPTTESRVPPRRLSQYEQETLSHLYATHDYLNCNDLPGVKEIEAAINALEARV